MPSISLLSKTYTYTNGNPNDADEVELDMSNAYANFGTIETDYNQLVTGAYTLAGVKTFSAGIVSTTARLTAAPATTGGSLGYASNTLQYYNGTKVISLTEALNAKHFIGGNLPTYNNAASIIIPQGVTAFNSDNTAIIEAAGNLTVSLASSGANGLDAGSEASDTWYYVYLIGDTSATNPTAGLFSVTNEAASGTITLPSGYDIKRQLPLAVRNDGSSNIIPFYCPDWGEVIYSVQCTHSNGSLQNGTTQVLSAGTATTPTSVSCSSFIPAISEYGYFNYYGSGSHATSLAPAGSSRVQTVFQTDASGLETGVAWCQTSTAQAVEYDRMTGSGSAYLDVMGYIVTELPY